MTPRLILIPLIIAMAAANAAGAWAQDKGTVHPKPLPPLANPNDPEDRRQGTVRPQGAAGGDAGAGARVLCPRLHRGRRRAADQRRYLAGDAVVAQSQLGASRPDRAGQAAGRKGAQGCRLARHPGRRHVAAPRRADVDRSRQPSGGARRRHLADADAGPSIVAQRARGDVGGDDGSADRLDIDPRVLRRAIFRSSAPPRRNPACSASSSMPRSRRHSAATQKATATGCTRCGRCTATTITSISASNARRAPANATASPNRKKAKAAAAGDLAYWFRDAVLHPKPPKVPPKPKPPMTMAALPPACKAVLQAPDAKP